MNPHTKALFRNVQSRDTDTQYERLRTLIFAPEHCQDLSAWNATGFTWLMNIIIIFIALTQSDVTRLTLEPINLPLDDVCTFLRQYSDSKIPMHEVGYMISQWGSILSTASMKINQEAIRGPNLPALVTYLGICTSALHRTVRERLDPAYVDYHDRFVQFHPRDISVATLYLPSPFERADIKTEKVVLKDHVLESSLTIREYLPIGWEQTSSRHRLLSIVWFPGGRYHYTSQVLHD